jgi:hypothetical protein
VEARGGSHVPGPNPGSVLAQRTVDRLGGREDNWGYVAATGRYYPKPCITV